MKLDLHGVKHQDVVKMVDAFIWEHMKLKTTQVQIITGNSDKMKAIVRECLDEYGMTGAEQFMNTGTLVVDLV